MTTDIDFLTPTKRSELMRRVRSSKTGPELALLTALQHFGITELKTNDSSLPGKPDIVIHADRIALFVDGEFWHGGQWRKRGLESLSCQFPNPEKRERWMTKILGNCARDFAQTAKLLADDWTVIRFWAGDIERDDAAAARLVVQAIVDRKKASPASCIPEKGVSEFFAGIGLARMGLDADGWTVKFANDKSADKVRFYKENVPLATYMNDRDVQDVTAADVPTVALATACFPCTDLSLAGAQRGLASGTESSAYLKFTALLLDMAERRPPFVLLENVLGMISSRGGADFTICLEQLQQAGYTVDPFVLDAKWFVPQSRPRLFIVAVRNDLQPSRHVKASESDEVGTLRPAALREFIASHPELPWSLRPLPSPEQTDKGLKKVLEKLREDDPRWWSEERAAKLYKQMSDGHQKVVRKMKESKRVKYGTVFRRMRNGKSMAEIRTDGIAGCLRTPKGGSARQILFRVSNGRYSVRLLTPRECARLMGADGIRIPEDFSENKALFAFGDGVCVPVIRWIAEHYLTPMATELIRGCVLRLPAK